MEFLKMVPAVAGRFVTSVTLILPSGHMEDTEELPLECIRRLKSCGRSRKRAVIDFMNTINIFHYIILFVKLNSTGISTYDSFFSNCKYERPNIDDNL